MTHRARRTLVLALAPLLLAVITWTDYYTGYDLGLFVFYFVPVAAVAWYGSRAVGIAGAILAGGCWYLSDLLSHHPYSRAYLIYWETFMRLVTFLATAVTFSKIRDDLARREELLDVISHDLRSPLGALVGQAQILAKRSRSDAFVTARVDSILRCASRMDLMIEDLLDAAREETRQLALTLEPIDLQAYATELVERYAPVLEVQRIRLALDPGVGAVLGDRGRLDRILLNLLLNAQKYSPPDRPVELAASAENGRVTIRVTDEGPGIPYEDLPHIFERFYRGSGSAARGGLGLGLYSVRLLVEAHGGTVRAVAGPRGGTSFLVTLPAAKGAATAGPAEL